MLKMFSGHTGANLSHQRHHNYQGHHRHILNNNNHHEVNFSQGNRAHALSQQNIINGINNIGQNAIPQDNHANTQFVAGQQNILSTLNYHSNQLLHNHNNGHQQQDVTSLQQQHSFIDNSSQLANFFVNTNHHHQNSSSELTTSSNCNTDDILQLGNTMINNQANSTTQLYDSFQHHHNHQAPSIFQCHNSLLHHDRQDDQLEHELTLVPQNHNPHQQYINLLCIANPSPSQTAANNNLQSVVGNSIVHQLDLNQVTNDSHNSRLAFSHNISLSSTNNNNIDHNANLTEAINNINNQMRNHNDLLHFEQRQIEQSQQLFIEATNLEAAVARRRSSSQSYNSNIISVGHGGKSGGDCVGSSGGSGESINKNIVTVVAVRNGRKGRRNSESPRRTFNCPTCGKGFTEKFNMKRHMQIHAQSRPKYICNECTKSFAWKDNFIRHKKAAHGTAQNLLI